jgi:hypothetical protein
MAKRYILEGEIMVRRYILDIGDKDFTPECIKKAKGKEFDFLDDALIWISSSISEDEFLSSLQIKFVNIDSAISKIYVYKPHHDDSFLIATLIREVI